MFHTLFSYSSFTPRPRARHDGAPDRRLFARNAPLAESRLVGFPAASFQRVYPEAVRARATFLVDGGAAGGDADEGELWTPLAALLLAVLLMESLCAWRFGRR